MDRRRRQFCQPRLLFQYAVSTKASVTDLDPEATVVSIDGMRRFDLGWIWEIRPLLEMFFMGLGQHICGTTKWGHPTRPPRGGRGARPPPHAIRTGATPSSCC